MRNPGSGTCFNSKLRTDPLEQKELVHLISVHYRHLQRAPGGKQNMQQIDLDHPYDLQKKKNPTLLVNCLCLPGA